MFSYCPPKIIPCHTREDWEQERSKLHYLVNRPMESLQQNLLPRWWRWHCPPIWAAGTGPAGLDWWQPTIAWCFRVYVIHSFNPQNVGECLQFSRTCSSDRKFQLLQDFVPPDKIAHGDKCFSSIHLIPLLYFIHLIPMVSVVPIWMVAVIKWG